MLEHERLGIIECIRSLKEVYQTEVNDGLVLRALTYFDDAEAEARLLGEGPEDWATVKEYFVSRAGALLLPPNRVLAIQTRTVDVRRARPERRRR